MKKLALGKRSRYYQKPDGHGDVTGRRGLRELPNTCDIHLRFDPIGVREVSPYLRMKCEESAEAEFEDGRTVVFLNTHGKNEGEVPKELVTLLHYIREDADEVRENLNDSYGETSEIYSRGQIKPGDGGTLFMILKRCWRDQPAEGRAEGIAGRTCEGLALRLENAKSTLLLYLKI